MNQKPFHDEYFHSENSDYSSDNEFDEELNDEFDDEFIYGIENAASDSDDLEYDPEENIIPPKNVDLILQDFENEYI